MTLARAGVAAVRVRRKLRIAVLVLVGLPALAGGGLLLVRHSPLSAVEHVQIDGLLSAHGADTGAIEAALTSAAHGMSTLAVKPAALQAAVAQYPIVQSVRTYPKFPHGLRIEVIERPPVAELTLAGARTAVAADGIVLGPGFLSSSLPVVNPTKAEDAASLPAPGHSVRGGGLSDMLSVLGAAPPALARAVRSVYSGSKGLTIALRGRLLAYFGDATRSHAKWIALIRVLADPSSAGAAYVDVRLPERPAAGFAPGTTRPGSSAEAEPSSASDPNTAAELAAGLDSAVSGGSTSAPASSGAGSGSSAGGEPGSSDGTGAGSGMATEPSSSGTSASTGASESTGSATSGETGTSDSGESEAPG